MAKKNLAELLVDILLAAGVKRVYGVAGDSLNGITEAIRTHESIKWIHVRHEETAAFAAGAEAHLENPSRPVIPTSNGLSYSMNSLPRSACTIGAFNFPASCINSVWASAHPAPPKMVTFRDSLRMPAALARISSEGRTVVAISAK
jgi:glyoxylate carboligase